MQYLIQFPQKMLPLDQAGHHFSVAGVIFHFFFLFDGWWCGHSGPPTDWACPRQVDNVISRRAANALTRIILGDV